MRYILQAIALSIAAIALAIKLIYLIWNSL